MRFDVGGYVTLSVHDTDARITRSIRAQLDPYESDADEGRASDVVLEADDSGVRREFRDILNPAGDGTVTASDGESHYLLFARRSCTLAEPWRRLPAHYRYEPGFPVSRLMRSVVRPALQVAVLERDAVAVHSTAVEIDGRAILVGGWSESGKTETALSFVEDGARFVSDKWTIVGRDGAVAAFPISVGVRRWVLRYLPTLRAALPARVRAQLLVAGAVAAGSRPLVETRSRRTLPTLAAKTLGRAVVLADRASLRPSEIMRAYGHVGGGPLARDSLAAVALLTTVAGDEVRIEGADPVWAARRLARSAAFERRAFLALDQRARFAFPDREASAAHTIEAREESLLTELLGRIEVFDVRAPFPTDPRRVRDAIASRL
ncbi:MAG: hypothetical protein M3377_03775 [Actinomycetota bacterium]|nr:hypothetical protein [Actinomycetota bacterium]